jgi:hypothetical protein
MSRRRRDYQRWYEVMPVRRDIENIQEYPDWLSRVSWKVYATFTFAWPVSDGQANRVFAAFINWLEYELGAPIAFVRGDEKRWSGCGMPASPRHFHVLMASTALLDPLRLVDRWRKFGGSGRLKFNGADYEYDSAKVMDDFDSRQKLEYSLKFVNQTDGDWAHRNLHYFASDVTSAGHRAKRRAARKARRANGTAVRGAVVAAPATVRWRSALAPGTSLPRIRPRRVDAPPAQSA